MRGKTLILANSSQLKYDMRKRIVRRAYIRRASTPCIYAAQVEGENLNSKSGVELVFVEDRPKTK